MTKKGEWLCKSVTAQCALRISKSLSTVGYKLSDGRKCSGRCSFRSNVCWTVETVCCGTQRGVLGQRETSEGFNKYSGFTGIFLKVELRAMLNIMFSFLRINHVKLSGCINKLFLQTSNWILAFSKAAKRLSKPTPSKVRFLVF